MAIQTVAIMAPGDMGHAVGRVLVHGGVRVVTNLVGRSRRTVDLAEAAGIEAVDSDAALLAEADAVFSIMPPDQAPGFIERMVKASEGVSAPAMLVDLNAVSPGTAHELEAIARAGGLDLVDGGIIGGPPKVGGKGPRLYVSGPRHEELVTLRAAGLDIRPLAGGIGAASAIKMSYATMTKGLIAISMQAMITARLHGVGADFGAELRGSQQVLVDWLEGMAPNMPPKAYRWVGEMEEIADTFAEAGMTDKMFRGAAELYDFIKDTPLGREVVESRTMGATTDEVADLLAGYLKTDRQA